MATATTFTTRLASLSETMGLSLPETAALPTVVEVIARRAMMSRMGVVVELERNAPLRDYAKTLCAEGAKAL